VARGKDGAACTVAWALEGLRPAQRGRLHAFCAGAPLVNAKGEPAPTTADELDRMASRLVAAPAWEQAAFRRLRRRGEDAHPKPAEPQEPGPQGLLDALAAGLGDGRCPERHDELAALVRSYEEGYSVAVPEGLVPWPEPAADGPRSRRRKRAPPPTCHLGVDWQPLLARRDDLLLAVLLAPSDRPEDRPLVSAGQPPRSMPVSASPLPLGDHHVYLSFVLRNEPYLVEVPLAGTGVPWLQADVGRLPLPAPTSRPAAHGCLDVQYVLDETDAVEVLLEGLPLCDLPGPVRVPRGDRALTVLRQTSKGWTVVHRDDVTEEALPTSLRCAPVVADLRASRALTLAPLRIEPACVEGGMSPGELWGEAARFLDGPAVRAPFRDMRTVGETMRYLEYLQSALQRGGATPIGEAAGRPDAGARLASLASELWRQGIGKVVTLDVSCPRPRGDQPALPFLLARSVDVELMYGQVRDRVAGAALSRLVRSESEAVREPAELLRAVRRVLARLLDLPYLRFAGERRAWRRMDDIEIPLEHVAPRGRRPAGRVEVKAHDVSGRAGRGLCRTVERTGRIAGHPPSEVLRVPAPILAVGRQPAGPTPPGSRSRDDSSVEWSYAPGGEEPASRDGGSGEGLEPASQELHEVELKPWQAGTTLLEARLLAAGEDGEYVPYDEAYRCVAVPPTPWLFWAKYTLGMRGVRGLDSLDEGLLLDPVPHTTSYSGLRLGVSRHINPVRNWQWGVYLGFLNAVRSLPGPPSWDDLAAAEEGPGGDEAAEALDFGGDGALELLWVRQSLDLGVAVGYEGPVCRMLRWACGGAVRRITVSLGAELGLDFGLLSTKRVPRRLEHFLGGRSDEQFIDLDSSFGLQAGAGYYVTSSTKVELLLALLLPGLDDYVAVLLREDSPITRRITYDFAVVPAVGLRVGYGR